MFVLELMLKGELVPYYEHYRLSSVLQVYARELIGEKVAIFEVMGRGKYRVKTAILFTPDIEKIYTWKNAESQLRKINKRKES